MTKVLITGGSGLIGQHLSKMLVQRGYEVNILSRSVQIQADVNTYLWDYRSKKIDAEALAGVDYIIHLAGANVGEKRWTASRKQQILDSRVGSAEFLLEQIKAQGISLKGFISASAVGYYGTATTQNIYVEDDAPATDFLGQICFSWEQVADKFETIGARTVKIRTGLVLDRNGGALKKMAASFQFRTQIVLGSGLQYLPWIHIDDLCAVYIRALEDAEMSGSYNAVAPEHITYQDFATQLSVHFPKPLLTLRMPAFVLKALMGQMSEILLEGSRISCQKLEETGFQFSYASLKEALDQLWKK